MSKIKKAKEGSSLENISKYGGKKVVSGAEKRNTIGGMSNYRQNKISKRNDVLAERQIGKAKGSEKKMSKKLGREITSGERKGILRSSNSSNSRTSNALNKGSKFGNMLRSINPFKRR